MRSGSILAFLAVLWSATALADSGPPPQTMQPSSGGSPDVQGQMLTPRQQAEGLFADAYKDIEKARADLADGKDKNAEKKFRRALEHVTRATELDTTYYEAWNLVGYTSRKLKLYDAALTAYDRCLRIKPDYALAREYLGEAFFELGRSDDARAQLTWLDRMHETKLADQLRGKIGAPRDSSRAVSDSTTATKPASGW